MNIKDKIHRWLFNLAIKGHAKMNALKGMRNDFYRNNEKRN